jgi:hypothetical protein
MRFNSGEYGGRKYSVTLAAQHRHQRRNRPRCVDRGVIQDDRQGFGDLLIE